MFARRPPCQAARMTTPTRPTSMKTIDSQAFVLQNRKAAMLTATAAARAPAAARPIITFGTSVRSDATPQAVYALLADVTMHLDWAGRQAPDRHFRLLSLEGPAGQAAVGTEFTSTGSNILRMSFHDRSVVTEALPSKRFAFETESRCERMHRSAWQARFVSTYELRPEGTGTRIDHTIEAFPLNYRPWWLHPLMRPMMRRQVPKAMRKTVENLARTASRRSAT